MLQSPGLCRGTSHLPTQGSFSDPISPTFIYKRKSMYIPRALRRIPDYVHPWHLRTPPHQYSKTGCPFLPCRKAEFQESSLVPLTFHILPVTILSALSSRCIPNLTTSYYFHRYHPSSGLQCFSSGLLQQPPRWSPWLHSCPHSAHSPERNSNLGENSNKNRPHHSTPQDGPVTSYYN